jgi:hypothetical protein
MRWTDRGASCLLLAILGVSVARAEDVVAELKACARTSETDRRIACYEALGTRVLNEDASSIPSTAAAALPDDVGGKEFRKQPERDAGDDTLRGHIVACTRSFDDKWIFTFENGQVWKQADSSRVRYADCDFMASITKDYFGYKLQIDGSKTKTRISRVQ